MIARRVLITGSSGFIGSRLRKALLGDPDLEVLSTDNQPLSMGEDKNFLLAEIDSDLLRQFILEKKPEAVFHLAAQTNVRKSILEPSIDYRINVTGTLNVLKACSELENVKVIFANSGGAIFGETESPATELTSRFPISPYGLHKVIAQELVKSFSSSRLTPVILNLSNVYGIENAPKSAPAIFLERVFSGKTIELYGNGYAERDWVHVDDVILAMVLVFQREVQGDFNISTGKSTSIATLIALIEEVTGKRASISKLEAINGEIQKSVMSSSKAKIQLDWEPTIDLKLGLKLMLQAIRQQNV